MTPLIRNGLAVVFLTLSVLTCFADAASTKPVTEISLNFHQIIKLDSFLNARQKYFAATGPAPRGSDAMTNGSNSNSNTGAVGSGAGRICSCQVLNLASSNYSHEYVVLLAEKTNDGTGAAFELAKKRIQREKKHLKTFFYDTIQVVSEMQGTGSCRLMFNQLQNTDKKLKLFEILNADNE